MTDDNTAKTGLWFQHSLDGIQRNKLACFICSLTSVLFVSLAAILLSVLAGLISLIVPEQVINISDALSGRGNPFFAGAVIATFGSAMNFIVFYVTIPVTCLIMCLSVGRLVHKRFASKWSYIRLMAIWGAVLVGAVCILAGAMVADGNSTLSRQLSAIAGAVSTGALIGALAGFANGWLFILILRPESQLRAYSDTIADAF